MNMQILLMSRSQNQRLNQICSTWIHGERRGTFHLHQMNVKAAFQCQTFSVEHSLLCEVTISKIHYLWCETLDRAHKLLFFLSFFCYRLRMHDKGHTYFIIISVA